ncbi:Cdc6/Cdc18 family protein [Halosimplex halophilum]|uniref:Cdc6/Cdc18 family protein n=1 Tax=Halosimplex halophilum TaxID=2559572 RepID=UPI002482D18D|nr:ORC1-type DNA replication protein [Halosimplex halophilum]
MNGDDTDQDTTLDSQRFVDGAGEDGEQAPPTADGEEPTGRDGDRQTDEGGSSTDGDSGRGDSQGDDSPGDDSPGDDSPDAGSAAPEGGDPSSSVRGSVGSADVDLDAGGDGVDSSVLDDVMLDDVGSEDTEEASQGLFDDLLAGDPIFENKEVLRPSYTPRKLPHREEQINNMATILVTALRGDSPSNILIYGKTGTGKTASAKFVSTELESTSQKYEVPCEVEYINCEVTDTQYRVLAQLANKFIEKNEAVIDEELDALEDLRERARDDPAALADTEYDSVAAVEDRIEQLEDDRDSFEQVPMTGWPTDRVYSTFFDAVDYHERVVVIMLDEIDKLVEKSGDDTLYNLSRMNSELERSRVSIMGISNDLKFTDFLDPRVKSSLGEEEIVFPPYDANQLRDILEHRAEVAFEGDALTDDVIPLCAAFAAQEHGDARRALDLLRTAGELAERDQTDDVNEDHVRKAQEKIELDRVVEVVRTLPTQSKLVLFAIIMLEKNGVHNINTGEVYNVYQRLCEEIDVDTLTQRRVTDLISELDMLGIVNAVVVSKGRYGRTKEISLSVPIDETEAVLLSDSRLSDIEDTQPFVQTRFDSDN